MAKLSDFISNTQPNTQTSSANAKQKSTGPLSAYIESNDVKPNKTKVATSSMPLVSLTGSSGKEGEKILSPQELANIGKTTTPTTSKVSLNDIYYKFEADKAAGMAKQLQPKPSTVDRVKNFFTGNAKDYGGSTVNALGTLVTAPLGAEESQRIAELGRENTIKKWEDALKDPNLNFITRWIYEQRLKNAKSIGTPDEATANADKLIQGGAKDLAVTKKGLSNAAKTGVDIGSAVIQLAGDAAIAYATGGSALVPMGVRSFGSGAAQARYAGGDTSDQLLYGGLNAGTAVLTEKLFNVGKVFNKVYGKGAADDVIQGAMNRAINKYVSSNVGKAVASRIGTGVTAGVGEGFEEMIQSSLDPLYQKVTFNPDAKLDLEQVFYEGLIGGSIGFLVGGGGGSNINTNMPTTNVPTVNAQTQTAPNLTPNLNTPQQAVQATTIAPNLQTTTDVAKVENANATQPVDNQTNAKADVVPNVNTITPNLVKPTQNIAQQATQAPTVNEVTKEVKLPTNEENATEVKQSVPEAKLDILSQPKAEVKNSVLSDKDLLEKANTYTDEYYMSLDDATTDEEFKTWRSIRDKMVAKYRSETPTVSENKPKYEVGQYVRTTDGKEGEVSTVTMFEGTPSYSITTEDGETYSAIKQFYLTDISKSKPVRDSFIETITNKAQKTKALDYLKSKGEQDRLDKLADMTESRSEKYDYTHATKDGKSFTTSKYRIYSGENNGKTFIEVPKVAFDYFNFKKTKPINNQSSSLFPENPLVANVTKGMPQGTGAMSNPYESNQKVSEVYTNTLKNTDEISDTAKAQLNEKDFTFDSVGEKQSKGIANQRTDFDYEGEVAELKSDSAFTAAEDVDTAFNILERVAKESDESGNGEELNAIAKQIYKKSHQNAVALQAMDKHSRTPATAVVDAHRVVSQIADEMTTKKELGKPVDTALGRQVKTESTQIENVVKTEGKQSANDVVEEITQSIKKQGKKSEGKKPANLNPLAEKTDAEKAAEKLAGKVASTTKERKPIEVNAINDMVNELFKSAKESPLPEQAPRPKRSPIEFLTQAIKNKSEYTDVWNNAKEILLEKYADNPEVLDMLNDYFNKGIVPTYSDATLTSSVKQMLKDLGIKLSQMKELTWENRQRVIKSLTNYLVEQTGAVDGDAKMLKRDAADKITKLIIDSAPTLTKKQKLEIKQATQDAMRKHGVPVESWADETGRLIAEGISKKFAPPEAPKPNAMTSVISDDIKKFVGKLPAQIKPVIGRNAIDRYTDFMENRQYYTEAWSKLQSELKVKYANNPEALKAIDTIINRNAETAATEYYSKELDGMINKALKSINVKLSELVTRGKASKEATVKAVTDILVNEHGIDGDTAKTISENIAERFNEMLKEKASQRIANIIKAKSSIKIKQTERQRMNALMNLGSFDMDSLSDLIKAKYGVPTITSADAQKIYELNKLAQETNNDYQKRVFENRAARIIADKLPVKGKDKVLAVRRIAMLLNPKTLISRNAGGNVIFGLLDDIKDMPGTLIDLAVSTKTGQRTTSYNPLATTIAEAKGFGKGVSEWGKDIKNKVDTSPTQHEMPQAPALKSAVGKGFESALNKLLQLGDRPFYEAAKAKRLDELKRLGLDYTSEDAIAQANVYALEKVFQNDSEFAKSAMQMREALNKVGGVLGDITIPFAQTPANIFDKLADYSPLGYVRAIKKAGTIKDSAWSQKQFVDTLARSMTGTGILAFAFFAAKSGLITGGDNKEEDEALTYQKKISGWQPYSIVVGDKSYTYDWATVVGALLSLGADIAQSENAGDTLLAILSNGAKAGINTMFNQSYMEGVAELFGSSTNGKADIGKGLESMLVSLPASFTPTAFQQIAKIIDPIARDTYDTDPLKRAWNKVKAKLPFLSQTLPAKISASGQESTNYQGGKLSNILESTLSPGFIGETQKTAIDSEVQRLYKVTDDTAVLPNWSEYTSKSDLSFSGNGTEYTMTAKEWETYQKTRGQYTYKELNTLINSSEYKSMTDEGKAKAVSDIYSAATLNAKQTVVEARGEMFVPSVDAGNKIAKYQSAGLSQKQAYDFYKTVEALEPEAGEKEVSTYQKVQTIGQQGYSDTQAIALVGTLYTDSSKESMLPYLTTSKHLLSLYLTNKDSEMISMTIPSKVTAKSVEYELTDKEKEVFKTTYANYFNSRVTNVSSATAIKSLRDKAFDAAKTAVINGR